MMITAKEFGGRTFMVDLCNLFAYGVNQWAKQIQDPDVFCRRFYLYQDGRSKCHRFIKCKNM